MDHTSGDINIITKTKPSEVILRFATTYDAIRRDFRLIKGNTPQDPCTFIPVKVCCCRRCDCLDCLARGDGVRCVCCRSSVTRA